MKKWKPFVSWFGQICVCLLLSACNWCVADDDASLAYVNQHIDQVWVVRPAAILKSRDFLRLKRAGGESLEKSIAILSDKYFRLWMAELHEIDQVVVAEYDPSDNERTQTNLPYKITIVRTIDDHSKQFELLTQSVSETVQYQDQEYFLVKRPGYYYYVWIVDKQTIVLSAYKYGMQASIDAGKEGPKQATWYSQWETVKEKPISFFYDSSMLKKAKGLLGRAFPSPLEFTPLENIELLVGDVTPAEESEINAVAFCRQSSDAKAIKTFLEQGLELIWRHVQAKHDGYDDPDSISFYSITADLLKSSKVTAKGKQVRVSAKVKLDFTKLQPVIDESYLTIKRMAAGDNMRVVSTGFHNFFEANKKLPVSVYVSDSGKKYSWRIAILPHIGEQALYDQYRFDEEWDSPHNRQVTSRMPDFFRSDVDDKQSTKTSWMLLTGPGGAADGGLTLEYISNRDGTSQTIMAVESNQQVHWAKPEDLAVDPENPFPKLGGYHKGGFHAAFVDASVRFLDENIPEVTLRELFTINGGEEIDMLRLQYSGGKKSK